VVVSKFAIMAHDEQVKQEHTLAYLTETWTVTPCDFEMHLMEQIFPS